MSTAELSARFLLAFVLSLIAGSLTVWAFQAARCSDWLSRIKVSAKDFRYRLAYVRFAVREAFPAGRDGVGLRYSPRFGHVPPLCRVYFHRQLIAGIERVRYQLAELEILIGEHQIDVVTGKADLGDQHPQKADIDDLEHAHSVGANPIPGQAKPQPFFVPPPAEPRAQRTEPKAKQGNDEGNPLSPGRHDKPHG